VNAPKDTADATLDALAAALAPRVARLLRERANDDGDAALAELLERAGYELATDDGGAS
jgi:hypothetical protein